MSDILAAKTNQAVNIGLSGVIPAGTSSFRITNVHSRSIPTHLPGPEGSSENEFGIDETTNPGSSAVLVGGDPHEEAVNKSGYSPCFGRSRRSKARTRFK